MSPVPVLCDLDGVVWLAHRPIAGSAEAIAALRARGHRVLFVTNNSSATVADQERALSAVGVPAVGDVVTSALAGARLVEAGERILVCGGPGVEEAIGARGAISIPHDVADSSPIDAVMVGFHRHFDYEILRRAAGAVRRGARLIATNDDATYPTPDGPIPGGGSIVAAIATAAGVDPVIAGKPNIAMAMVVRDILGGLPADAVMVGDRPSTDGLFARTLGCRYALVRSGVTPVGAARTDFDADGLEVHLDVADLAAVARWLIESS